jgi:hypothetical protein
MAASHASKGPKRDISAGTFAGILKMNKTLYYVYYLFLLFFGDWLSIGDGHLIFCLSYDQTN